MFFYLVAIGGHCLANFYWTYPRRSLYPYTWMGPCAICNNMHFWRFSTSVILLPQKRWTGVESNNLFTLLPTSLDSGLDLSSPVSSDQDHVSLSIIWNIYTGQTGKISRLQDNAKSAQIFIRHAGSFLMVLYLLVLRVLVYYIESQILKIKFLTNLIFEPSLQGRDGKDVSVGELTTRIRRLQPEHGHKHRRGQHSISQNLFTSFHPFHPHLLLLCDSYSAGAAAVSEKGA